MKNNLVKKYDIIIFGASGFTGKLVTNYLLLHNDTKKLKIALAGRSKKKLKNLTQKYDKINPDILIADCFNKSSIDEMTNSAKLIISLVGPYSIYGEYLVESCIKNSTHYLDLTGEPNFVKKIRRKFSETKFKSIIINCCGLESVIPDFGVLYTIKKMNSKIKNISFFFTSNGSLSGGTWASFINVLYSNQILESVKINEKNSIKKNNRKIYFNNEFKKWVIIFPDIDKQIVYRSSRSDESYGKNFTFEKYMMLKNIKQLLVIILSFSFISILAKFGILKNWLLSLRPSGSGPSDNQIKKSWFKAIFVGEGNNEKVKFQLSGGDPGYGDTAKFISEIALCVTNQYELLNKKEGILTPVECTGELMIDRLKNAGIKFQKL